ncbi:MAG: Rab family GTPase [Candidatus Odinarchaeota archaeon]
MTLEQTTSPNELKIAILGEGGVGKTSLCKTYDYQKTFLDTSLTVAVEFHVMRRKFQGEDYTLQIWDLGGQKQFRKMGVFAKFTAAISGAVVCFDLTDILTINSISEWFSFIPDNAPAILVGTKADLAKSDSFVLEEVQYMIDTYGFIDYIETSALDVSSVESVFSLLLTKIVELKSPHPFANTPVASN